MVHLATAAEVEAVCPSCRTPSSAPRGWAVTRPRDLPVGGRRPRLVWRKRRWYCDQPSCRRGSFTEAAPDIPPRKRLTGRLRAAAGAAVADRGATIVQSARDHAVSWPVVAAAFTAHAEAVLPAQPDAVAVLGIDEIRRGRPHWVADEAGGWKTTVERWHVGFVDLSGGQGLLGQVEGRTAKVVIDWLHARPTTWRQQVRFVAIDMCTIFKAAVRTALPHAQLVVDHFHLVALANRTVNLVRRRVTASLRGRRVRASDPEYGIRRRLLRNREDPPTPAPKHVEPADRLDAPGEQILSAWIAKEELRTLLALARTHPTRHQISHRLWDFYRRCADSNIPELAV